MGVFLAFGGSEVLFSQFYADILSVHALAGNRFCLSNCD